MDSLPAYVRDYRLETEFHKRRIVHIYDDPDAPPGSQRRRETWKSGRKPIGSGGQGRVFLHTCTSGNRLATHRAVKMIPLQLGSGRQRYGQELATMIKFSHSKTWWIKLADFGISKCFGNDADATSTVMGTREYMAPELQDALPPLQSTLAPIPDHPLSDMWSVGAMVFRMLTGTSAFSTPWHLVRFCDGKGALFPNTRLDDRDISPAGQAFIQALLMPQPTERLTSTAALTHPWVRADAAAAAAIPTDESESSAPSSSQSSRASSFDEERGMTTRLSAITGLSDLPDGHTDQRTAQSTLQLGPRSSLRNDTTVVPPPVRLETRNFTPSIATAEREPSLSDTDSDVRSDFRGPSWASAELARDPFQFQVEFNAFPTPVYGNTPQRRPLIPAMATAEPALREGEGEESEDDIAKRKSRRDAFEEAKRRARILASQDPDTPDTPINIRDVPPPAGEPEPERKREIEPVRDPIQEEANRVFREKKMIYKVVEEEIRSQIASPEPSVVGKWNEEVDEPIVRIVTPPEMKRPPKRSKYDGPNADVRLDNVILPRDLYRYQNPITTFPGGPTLMPVFNARDPSAERERPLLNLVLPTPRHTPSPEEQYLKQSQPAAEDVNVVTVGPPGWEEDDSTSKSVSRGEGERPRAPRKRIAWGMLAGIASGSATATANKTAAEED